MLNTLRIYHDLRETMDAVAAEKIADYLGQMYTELQDMVTKEDFRELKAAVKNLADAQNRTEQRVEELAAAQQRTENELKTLTSSVGRILLSRSAGSTGTRPKSRNSSALLLWQVNLSRSPSKEETEWRKK